MTPESKSPPLVAVRCPRCAWWAASTQGHSAAGEGGPLFRQLVKHLGEAHQLAPEAALRVAAQAAALG